MLFQGRLSPCREEYTAPAVPRTRGKETADSGPKAPNRFDTSDRARRLLNESSRSQPNGPIDSTASPCGLVNSKTFSCFLGIESGKPRFTFALLDEAGESRAAYYCAKLGITLK